MLQGKVALVTGASRGIGQAIALELAAQGAKVAGTATTQAGADAITAAITGAGGTGAGFALDVNDSAQCERVLGEVAERFGDVAVLVNNAGITADNLLIRMKDDEWDRIMSTNLRSVFVLSKLVLRAMMKARWGRIINVTSVVGQHRQRRPGELRSGESRHGRFQQVPGAGGRQPQHHGELHRAGIHRYRHDAGARREPAHGPARTGAAGSFRHRRRRSPRLLPISLPMVPDTSPAVRSTSTVACSWIDVEKRLVFAHCYEASFGKMRPLFGDPPGKRAEFDSRVPGRSRVVSPGRPHPPEGKGRSMDSVEQRVKRIVAEQLGVNEADIKTESTFVDDLGADSLDTVELVMALEEEFECEIPDEEAEKITSVQQAIDYVNAHVN